MEERYRGAILARRTGTNMIGGTTIGAGYKLISEFGVAEDNQWLLFRHRKPLLLG